MKKLTFVSILIYMFCFLYGCTSIDEASWKQHLMERERLEDRAPTFPLKRHDTGDHLPKETKHLIQPAIG